jgi:hypothetical protein
VSARGDAGGNDEKDAVLVWNGLVVSVPAQDERPDPHEEPGAAVPVELAGPRLAAPGAFNCPWRRKRDEGGQAVDRA